MSTVNRPSPDAEFAYALTQRDRTRIGDRSCLLRWSEQEKSACRLLSLSEKMSKRLPTRSIYLGYGQAAERV